MDLFQSEVSKVFPFEWLTVSKNGQQLKHLEEMEAKAKDALSYICKDTWKNRNLLSL